MQGKNKKKLLGKLYTRKGIEPLSQISGTQCRRH